MGSQHSLLYILPGRKPNLGSPTPGRRITQTVTLADAPILPPPARTLSLLAGEFFEIPNSKFDFVRQRPKQDLARPLNGGFAELPADVAVATYPKRQVKNSFIFSNTALEG